MGFTDHQWLLCVYAVVICFEISSVCTADEGRSFAFKTEDQYRQENWTAAGTSRGVFGWTDSNGEGIDIEFIADENGYRVIKKKNKVNVLSRQPRTKHDFDEFEFGDEEDDGSAYRFAYNTGTSFREEVKRGGVIFGKYGFITADNKLHVTYYSASKKRGFVPIREIRDPSEMAAIYAEPAKPVPIRRLRSLASPPDLLPDIVDAPTKQPVLKSTARNTTVRITTVPATTVQTTTVRTPTVPTTTVQATTVQTSTVQITKTDAPTTQKPPRKVVPKVNAVVQKPVPRTQRGPLAHSVPRPGSSQQFAYDIGRNFHRQSKEADGVSGKYGWQDAHGRLHEISYVADSEGYKVVSHRLKSNGTFINVG